MALAAAPACSVYRASLLDAARDSAAPDATGETTIVPDSMDTPVEAGPDRTVPPDGDIVTAIDALDAADIVDVPVDTGPVIPPACQGLISANAACLEFFAGHAFATSDPREIAPFGIALNLSAVNPTVFVGDRGTGRVMAYAQPGGTATRVAGTGIVEPPAALPGPAPMTSLQAPHALAVLTATGDLLIGDPVAHRIYRLRLATMVLEEYGTYGPGMVFDFQDGPWDLGFQGTNTLLIAADNRVYSMVLNGTTGDPAGTLTTRVGCATCVGFNTTAGSALTSLLNGPTGVDADANYYYFADSKNCRIRRAAVISPFTTTVVAGSGCFADDILASAPAGTMTIAATMARLGPVGDVTLGSDGAVYFSDPATHCAIMSVTVAGQLRIVAGDRLRCGVAGPGGLALGRLGAIAMNDARTTLYFVDQQNHRVGQLPTNGAQGNGGPPTWVLQPGVQPATGDLPPQIRAGSVSALAVTPTATAGSREMLVYWAGAEEGRVYRFDTTPGSVVTVHAGNGTSRFAGNILASAMEPGVFVGMGAYAAGRVLFASTSHHEIGDLQNTGAIRVAGTYDVPGDPGNMPALSERITSPNSPVGLTNDAGTLVRTFFATRSTTGHIYTLQNTLGTAATLSVVAGLGTGVTPMVPSGDAGVPATTVDLGDPRGLAVDATGAAVFVADPVRHVVWRVDTTASTVDITAGIYGQVTPLSDTPGDARGAAVPDPAALALDVARNRLYIADRGSKRIRVVDLATGQMSTLAGQGTAVATDHVDPTSVTIGRPAALALYSNMLYYGEADTGLVRRIYIP